MEAEKPVKYCPFVCNKMSNDNSKSSESFREIHVLHSFLILTYQFIHRLSSVFVSTHSVYNNPVVFSIMIFSSFGAAQIKVD